MNNLSFSKVTGALASFVILGVWLWHKPDFEPLGGLIAAIVLLAGIIVILLPRQSSTVEAASSLGIIITTILGLVIIIGSEPVCVARGEVPAVCGVNVGKTTLTPGERTEISIIAKDSDGDPLVYYWSSVIGSVPTPGGPRGPKITYQAPLTVDAGWQDIVTAQIVDIDGNVTKYEVTILFQAPFSGE